MAEVTFTSTLRRHLDAPAVTAAGSTVRQVLDEAFRQQPRVRGYVLDDQGRLRRHVTVFVDGAQIADRDALTDPVGPAASVFVMQALSGG